MTTSKASRAWPPCATGSVNNGTSGSSSAKVLGQPWVSTSGSGSGSRARTCTKWIGNPSTVVMNCGYALSRASTARQSKVRPRRRRLRHSPGGSPLTVRLLPGDPQAVSQRMASGDSPTHALLPACCRCGSALCVGWGSSRRRAYAGIVAGVNADLIWAGGLWQTVPVVPVGSPGRLCVRPGLAGQPDAAAGDPARARHPSGRTPNSTRPAVTRGAGRDTPDLGGTGGELPAVRARGTKRERWRDRRSAFGSRPTTTR